MKIKCQWPDCGQKIEFDAAHANQKTLCPACQREIYLVPEKNSFSNFLLTMNSICSSIVSIYLDEKSIIPTKESPYRFILGFAKVCYLTFQSILLFSLSFYFYAVLFNLHLDSTSSDSNLSIFDAVASHPHIFKILISLWLWLVTYWTYKLIRVVFDIAEYLRQIASKK